MYNTSELLLLPFEEVIIQNDILITYQLTNLWAIHFTKRVFFWPCICAPLRTVNPFFLSYATFSYTFYFSVLLFPSRNFFRTWLVVLEWKHWRCISLSQKSARWKSVGFSVSFIFYFSVLLFPSRNFFRTSLVVLEWKHWRYISLSQKAARWKSVGFSVSFIIHMKILNTLCISKDKVVRHYVDLIVKVFEENSETTQGGGRGGS